MKKAPVQPSRESTPSPIRKALLEVVQNRMISEAWVQKQKDRAAGVGASAGAIRSSSASLEVDQQYVIIEDVNPPYEMRRIMLPSEAAERRPEQPVIQPTSLPLIPFSQERSSGHRVETTPKRIELERTLFW